MARRINPAKRANRPNPRADRNNQNDDNIVEFYGRSTKKKGRVRNDRNRNPSEEINRGGSGETSSGALFRPIKPLTVIPRNIAQETYIEALEDDSKTIVIGVGPPGTGKSFIQILFALKSLQEGKAERIFFSRPVTTTDGSNLGALPGSLVEKLAPYLGEAWSIMTEYLGLRTLTRLIEDGVIDIVPIALMRGRSFRNAMVIIEEAENIEPHITKLIFTRAGENSKILVNGDVKQCDMNQSRNGLLDFLKRLDKAGGSPYFSVCKFSRDDIQRHPVVAEVLRIYGEED